MKKLFVLYLILLTAIFFTTCGGGSGGSDGSDGSGDDNSLDAVSMGTSACLFAKHGTDINYSAVVPFKIIVTGGSPNHATGDYHFSLSATSTYPAGITVDMNGIIKSNGGTITVTDSPQNFELDITDGSTTITRVFSVTTSYVPEGSTVMWPIFQFWNMTLPDASKSAPYGATLCVYGGEPPYVFKLVPGYATLPGGLTLIDGVISGTIFESASGEYKFRVQCTDANSEKAIDNLTGYEYMEYTIYVE